MKVMEKVKVGMIGAGSLANSVHYPSLAESDDVEIAAICDLNEERLNNTAEKYQIDRRYRDYRRMVNEVDMDAVYIIMPPHHLFDLVIHCLNCKLNVFIEKPPGVTAEQTRNMALTAEDGRARCDCWSDPCCHYQILVIRANAATSAVCAVCELTMSAQKVTTSPADNALRSFNIR